MRFGLSDEQQALQESVRGFLARYASQSALRKQVATGEHDHETWALMADQLGVHGVTIDEEHGGAGCGVVELTIIQEEAGRALWCAPYFATSVLATSALRLSGDASARERWLPQIAAGELIATLAVVETEGAWSLESMETMATASGDRWVLNGTKQFVVAGASADLILVAASGPVGPSLFAVDGDAAGVTRELLPVLDATRPMARLTFNQTDAVLVGQAGGAADVLPALLDVASVALAAEQVGGAQACLEMAVEYAGSRVQFGRPIGSFQAIKHKCADMFADVESSRAIVQHAAWSLDAALPEAPLLARLVGAYVSDAYCRVASQNLQVHGGIGYTWEHDAQLYFKRAAASAQLLGSPTQHREQAAAMVGL